MIRQKKLKQLGELLNIELDVVIRNDVKVSWITSVKIVFGKFKDI